ncbi:MAG: hypothetical protein A2X13_03760 [Bacteroidetes bacterium GWC2_33_15]|nr:MAG: hypothetical protein A2X10_02480 [Bacteroidetes bacterium GWA2_33_15]OFX49641.1 MAG: hypothetical protein A2X13_03760 [Bacteroidetes bacterium GWC2_33_15]OFX65969.1 MAG: hypothetical protein A2X15_11075 [Bacteroidetes bacterium GWB2_32_14]OFX68270.1 MAG: hypothetical protein A2X14_07820 [Bacteroidetes bacterium GWD2_33_33]HAN18051.1 hypothetical protein [Bacteroidales bacterium]
MKEKEAYIDYEPHQLMLYVEKDDGTFGPMITGSHLSKNYIDDYFEKMEKLRLSLLQQLKDNLISPVEYYRVIHDFNVFELSKRTRISVFKVKKHLKVKGFYKAKVSDLIKYAEVFDVPVSNLFQVIVVEGRDSETKNGIPDENLYKVLQTKTQNLHLVITKFESGKK